MSHHYKRASLPTHFLNIHASFYRDRKPTWVSSRFINRLARSDKITATHKFSIHQPLANQFKTNSSHEGRKQIDLLSPFSPFGRYEVMFGSFSSVIVQIHTALINFCLYCVLHFCGIKREKSNLNKNEKIIFVRVEIQKHIVYRNN